MKINLKVGQQFVSADKPTWDDYWRNRTMTVESVNEKGNFVVSEEFEWTIEDIDWEKTKKLNKSEVAD